MEINFQFPKTPSEAFGADESVGEVECEKDGNGTAEHIVEYHRSLLLEPVAGAGVGEAQGEEDDRRAD